MFGLFRKKDANLERNRKVQKLREEQQRERNRKQPLEPPPNDVEPDVEPVYFRQISQNRFRARR